ncbi:MAG: hypothetical protein FJ167_14905, partial [Gammaproteobacteria bacterium]|nr:hypothetical protein [Gammaproteobacteria bacterium]
GSVFVGGDFSIFNTSSTGRRQVVKLTAAGAVDTGFSSPFAAGDTGASVNALALDNGGQLLVGGNFPTVGGGTPKHLVRLNASTGISQGSPLTAGDPNAQVRALSVQPNGKILLAGDFTSVNGLTRNHLARVNTDGTTDTLINFGSGPNARVLSLGSTATRILIGGEFTTFDGIARNRLAQLLGGDIGSDPNGFLQFSTATYTADEDVGSVGILVKRTGGLEGNITADYGSRELLPRFDFSLDLVRMDSIVGGTVSGRGSGYAVNNLLTIQGGTPAPAAGSPAVFRVTATDSYVNTFAVNLGGSGYGLGNTLTLSGGTFATPASFTVSALDSFVSAVGVNAGGSGYAMG